MAAMDRAGADAPAASVVINGREVYVDQQAATSWAAFKILRMLNSEDADSFAKMDAALQYAQLVSGLPEDAIVEVAGGANAGVDDVFDVVAQIIQAASPKN